MLKTVNDVMLCTTPYLEDRTKKVLPRNSPVLVPGTSTGKINTVSVGRRTCFRPREWHERDAQISASFH
jgi:hypothetical protein